MSCQRDHQRNTGSRLTVKDGILHQDIHWRGISSNHTKADNLDYTFQEHSL